MLQRTFIRLMRTPGTTLAAVATLAGGIAAAAAMFSLIYPLLIRPLGYPEAASLFALQSKRKGAEAGGVSWQDVRDLRAGSRSIVAAAAYTKRTWGYQDSPSQPVEVVLSGMVTPEFFSTLGVELRPPAPHPSERDGGIWLTDSFWARRYHRDPRVLGSAVDLNAASHRIAGVLPAGFRFPIDGENPDIYVLLSFHDYCCQRGARGLGSIARLRRGATPETAQEELDALSIHLAGANRDSNDGFSFLLADLQAVLAGGRRRPLLLLGLASALLLLVAAANSAGILLAQAARRYREALTKISLGARASDLLRESLSEGLILGLLTSAAGLALTMAILGAAKQIPSVNAVLEGYAEIADIHPGFAAAAFALAASLGCALATRLAPLAFFRPGVLRRGLGAAATASAPVGAVRARHALIAGEVMLTTLLLAAGAAIFQNLHDALTEDKGFCTDQIVMAGIGIPEARYDTDEKMIAFHQRVLANLRNIPGVELAAGGFGLPLSRHRSRFLLGDASIAPLERPSASLGVASPGLFRLLGIPVVEGRAFEERDDARHPLVAVVNRAFARRYLETGEGLGTRMKVEFWNGRMKPWSEFQIIGIVADARNRSLDSAPEPAIYLSSGQVPLEGFQYFVRTPLPSASLAEGFRAAVWRVDPVLERVHPRPLAPYVEAGLERRKLAVWLIGLFGSVALLAAAAGLGAAMSALVSASKKEIAIRAALGETPGRAVARVLIRAGWLAVAGAGAGVTAAMLTPLASVLPACCAGALVLFVALLASATPARRAASMDAMESLRSE